MWGEAMRKTIEISDEIFAAAKAFAKENSTTMSALIEEGLRRVLDHEREEATSRFVLADATVRGEALVADPARWGKMEDEYVSQRIVREVKK